MLIAGPTASGKSAMALQLADRAQQSGREAWIVNADAMQVYDALSVITARPGPDDEARAPHRLYGHVPAETRYSVGMWLADVGHVLRQAEQSSVLPIIVGGTGLYFKALTEGLTEMPAVPAAVRRHVLERVQASDAAALYAELAKRDPASAAALRPSDRQRIIRALEVLEATGTGLHDWQRLDRSPPLLRLGEAAGLVLDLPRPELHARIDRRFERMVDMGAVDEVRSLLARACDPELPAMKAIGVKEIADHLRGETSLDAAMERAKAETRRYAKRQSTWLRNQMPDWPRSAS